MNLFKKTIALAMLVLSVAACTDLDELLENPNGVDPSRADAVSLYNSVQLNFRNVANSQTLYNFSAGLSRMSAEIGGFAYAGTHGPNEFDGFWNDAYADLFPDADAFVALAEPIGLNAEVASVKIMQAYTLMLLVDLFGDVPFSEAGLGASADNQILNPVNDSGADVYAAANTLLDDALVLLDGATDFASASFDNFYGGNAANWATLAKTMKIRSAVNTRLVNGAGDIAAIVTAGDIIDTNGENFEFQFGNNRANPDNRHPFYVNSYEVEDGRYQSNWFMWLLAESKGTPDPRARYYFYRQETNITGEGGAVETDPNAFDCNFTMLPNNDNRPPWYDAISEDMPYCLGSYDQGYFGRDHLMGSGIPPDGQLRTVYGLYPAGGKYDDGSEITVANNGVDGAQGAGIAPLWHASFTHFILAEAALTTDALDAADAADLLSDGIQLSMDRVRSFESLVDGSVVLSEVPVLVTIADTYMTDEEVADYIDSVMEEYESADANGRLAIVAREYLIALFGNGIEAYNLYRRTCLPADIQPAIDPAPGAFIRSALFPSVHVQLNQNVQQKGSFTDPVFWDTNPASCNY